MTIIRRPDDADAINLVDTVVTSNAVLADAWRLAFSESIPGATNAEGTDLPSPAIPSASLCSPPNLTQRLTTTPRIMDCKHLSPFIASMEQLPVEMVQRIVDHLQASDLCAVRASSSTLEVKTRSLFAERHLQRRSFCVRSPAQIREIETILSSERFSGALTDITLTLSNAPGLTLSGIDRAAISSSLKNIEGVEGRRITLSMKTHMDNPPLKGAEETTASYPFHTIIQPRLLMPGFMQPPEVLNPGISCAYHDLCSSILGQHKIHVLRLDETLLVDVVALEEANTGSIKLSMKDLHTAVFWMHHGTLRLPDHRHTARERTPVMLRPFKSPSFFSQVLLAAENLKIFNLIGQDFDICCTKSMFPLLMRARSVVLKAPLRLTVLHLENIPIFEQNLLYLLHELKGTLTDLRLGKLSLDVQSWRAVFLVLGFECTMLRCVEFRQLSTLQRHGISALTFDIASERTQEIVRSFREQTVPGQPPAEHLLSAFREAVARLKIEGLKLIQSRLRSLFVDDHHYRDLDRSVSILTVIKFDSLRELVAKFTATETFEDWRADHTCSDCGAFRGEVQPIQGAFGKGRFDTALYSALNAQLFGEELPGFKTWHFIRPGSTIPRGSRYSMLAEGLSYVM